MECEIVLNDSLLLPLFGEAGFQLYRLVAVYIRVSQVYLDMAEASYEATGNPDAVVTGCTMSARQALNKIRVRAGIGWWISE